MADNFGIWVESAGVVRSYKNGVLVGRYSHPIRTGGWTGVVALDTPGFHVDRIEWRQGGPHGALVAADDFDSLAAWTVSKGVATIDPAGHARLDGGGTSDIIRRATPEGADYVELLNTYFSGATGANHWGMVTIGYDGSSSYGENGYRVLIREYPPHEVQVPDATGALAIPPTLDPTVGYIGAGLMA